LVERLQERLDSSTQRTVARALRIQNLGSLRRVLRLDRRQKDGLHVTGVKRHESILERSTSSCDVHRVICRKKDDSRTNA
jgi:hypothetical protein